MEIARLIDLPYPTAYRIVQTLVFEGLIECEPSRKHYRATALVQSLSSGFKDQGNLITVARPHLVALTQKISWPVAIATHVGPWMMIRDSTHALTSLAFNNYHPGYTFPILECASGLAYMAFTSDEERDCILKGITSLDGRSPTISMFESRKLIARIREDGYATNDRTLHTPTPGKTSSISAPVFDDGKIAATLTMAYFSSAMRMAEAVRRYAPDIKKVAAEITGALQQASTLASNTETVAHQLVETTEARAEHASGKSNRRTNSKAPRPREPGKAAIRS